MTTKQEVKRTVCGIAASVNTVDDSGDFILPGAFTKSIAERGPNGKSMRKIQHLMFHDMTRITGKIITLEERPAGLYFESRLFNNDEGNNTLKMYEDGALNQHSIGYNMVPSKTSLATKGSRLWEYALQLCKNSEAMQNRDEIFIIAELDLFEISSVALGLNEFTPCIGLKEAGLDHLKMLEYVVANFKL